MPHTNSYRVTVAPSAVIQPPTSPPVHQDVHIPETRKCSQHFSCTWITCYLVGICSLAFVLCIAFVPFSGLFPVQVELYAFSVPLHRKGHLQLYPEFYDEEVVERFRTKNFYSISINPSVVENGIVPSLASVINEYPRLDSQEAMEFYVHCWLENPTNPNKPCYFDTAWLGNSCTVANKFGYEAVNGTLNPCFLLRIENAESWQPTVFSYEEVDKSWIKDYDPGFFGVGCHPVMSSGESSNEQTFSGIHVYPSKGFSLLFFPESRFNGDLYRRPLVMVQVMGMKAGNNVTLECRIRARNAYVLEDSGKVTITFQS